MLNKEDKIVVTGAAGLVGHNLIYQMRKQGFHRGPRIRCRR